MVLYRDWEGGGSWRRVVADKNVTAGAVASQADAVRMRSLHVSAEDKDSQRREDGGGVEQNGDDDGIGRHSGTSGCGGALF